MRIAAFLIMKHDVIKASASPCRAPAAVKPQQRFADQADTAAHPPLLAALLFYTLYLIAMHHLLAPFILSHTFALLSCFKNIAPALLLLSALRLLSRRLRLHALPAQQQQLCTFLHLFAMLDDSNGRRRRP